MSNLGAQTRIVMLVDFDYFFAQCEEKRNPVIKDRPVVVCVFSGRSENSGAVSTANYIARKYGVKSGMPIALAKRKLKDTEAFFLPVDHPFYDSISERIMRTLRRHGDIFEQVGVDEAYLDVTESTNGDFQKATELAQKMKEEVLEQEDITLSIGVATNKLVAKIASTHVKPDGLTVVKSEDVQGFLSILPVARLLGVGKRTEEKLGSQGVRTLGDLADYDVQKLIDMFGKKFGIYLHNASKGIDTSPVREREAVESISRISTLKENTRDISLILEKVSNLCDDIYAKVLKENIRFKTVSVVAIMRDLSIHSRSKSFDNPITGTDAFKRVSRELVEKMIDETELEMRRVGVKISNLSKETEKQKQITNYF